jgi:hypothetical protein
VVDRKNRKEVKVIMTYPFKIETKEDLYRLSELASKEDFSIYLSTSSEIFDAKSLLALFTILGKEVSLTAPDHINAEKFTKFIEKLKK